MSGMMQTITQAAGEALTLFCGTQMTRLVAQAFAGDTELQCERLDGWASAGIVQVDGTVYNYGSRSDTALSDLSCDAITGTVYGVQEAHALGAPVVDASRTTSFLDQTRRSIFVDTAEGEDLNVIGRNLGVPRDPAVVDDDHYREIIKAIAYNPRGTIYGLETALNAMVGVGNYKIVEDFVNYPCSIQLILPAGLFLSTTSEGHAYLDGKTLEYAASATEVDIAGAYTGIRSLQLADEQFYIDCRTTVPTATTLPTPAGTKAAFALMGAAGLAQIVQLGPGAGATQIAKAGTYLTHVGNYGPQSAVKASVVFTIPTGGTLSANDARSFAVRIIDGAYAVGFGCVSQTTASFSIGLCNPTASGTGALVAGTVATIARGTVATVAIEKTIAGNVLLRVNGRLVQTAALTSFPSVVGAAPAFDMGSFNSNAGLGAVRFVGLSSHTPTDALGEIGTKTASLAGTTLTDTSAAFGGAEEGQPIRITGSTVKNSLGGNNNGLFLAHYQSATTLRITGKPHPTGASVTQGSSAIVITATERAFVYPDDLGRSITLSGSNVGNNGTYTITAIVQDGTGANYGRLQTPVTGRGSTCIVQGAAFAAETGLAWQVTPTFASESNITYEVSNVASVTLGAASAIVNPVKPLAYPTAIYAAQARTMLSAQIVDTHLPVVTQLTQGPPITYSYAPAYASEPDNFVFGYVQSLLAAGITLRSTYD